MLGSLLSGLSMGLLLSATVRPRCASPLLIQGYQSGRTQDLATTDALKSSLLRDELKGRLFPMRYRGPCSASAADRRVANDLIGKLALANRSLTDGIDGEGAGGTCL